MDGDAAGQAVAGFAREQTEEAQAMEKRLFTIDQVADLLGADAGEVRQWIRQGWLPAQQLTDGSRRISELGLVEFLKGRGIDLEELMGSAGQGEGSRDAQGAEPAAAPTEEPVPVGDDEAADRAAREMLTEPPADEEAPDEEAAVDEEVEAEETAAEEATVDEEAPAEEVGAEEVAGEEVAAEEAPAEEAAAEEAAAEEVAGEEVAAAEAPADAAAQVAQAVLRDAVELGASRVHLEPRADGLALRLRIGGLLRDKPNFRLRLPEGLAPRLVRHLLARAGLGEADAARPQAGRFSLPVEGRTVGFDLSAFPTTTGPRLVLAVRDADVPPPDLGQLALAPEARERLERGLGAPGGALVVAAALPRAGMAEALGALAGGLSASGRAVLAVQAPGAEALAGSCRSQTDPLAGYSFAQAARGLAGQDAEAIVLGQLRGPTTATAAVEAALAGSTVVVGLRAAGAAEALADLAAMALEPWALASALKAVVVCRTVRRLCDHCKRAGETPDELPPALPLRREQLGPTLYQPVGCERCGQMGYVGTVPLAALVVPGAAVLDLVRRRADVAAFAAALRDAGAVSLAEPAAEKLRAGQTSLEEVARAL